MTDRVIMEFHHGGPSPARSFLAKLYQGGGKIDLVFDSKKTVTIQHNGGGAPIELMGPSVDGKVLWCSLEDGSEKFFDTATGLPIVFTTGGRALNDRKYRPKFYA